VLHDTELLTLFDSCAEALKLSAAVAPALSWVMFWAAPRKPSS
jgi:hypothetical protein